MRWCDAITNIPSRCNNKIKTERIIKLFFLKLRNEMSRFFFAVSIYRSPEQFESHITHHFFDAIRIASTFLRSIGIDASDVEQISSPPNGQDAPVIIRKENVIIHIKRVYDAHDEKNNSDLAFAESQFRTYVTNDKFRMFIDYVRELDGTCPLVASDEQCVEWIKKNPTKFEKWKFSTDYSTAPRVPTTSEISRMTLSQQFRVIDDWSNWFANEPNKIMPQWLERLIVSYSKASGNDE
jgi:hypothetical protein